MKKDFIPLGITLVLVLISLILTVFTNYTSDNKQIIGYSLIIISTLLYFTQKKAYLFVFGATLLLGFISLIYVSILKLEVSFGVGELGLKINPLIIVIMAVFLPTNKAALNELLPEKGGEDEIETELEDTSKLVRVFEEKFKSKTKSELESIVKKDSGYSAVAKEAASNLVEKNFLQQRV